LGVSASRQGVHRGRRCARRTRYLMNVEERRRCVASLSAGCFLLLAPFPIYASRAVTRPASQPVNGGEAASEGRVGAGRLSKWPMGRQQPRDAFEHFGRFRFVAGVLIQEGSCRARNISQRRASGSSWESRRAFESQFYLINGKTTGMPDRFLLTSSSACTVHSSTP